MNRTPFRPTLDELDEIFRNEQKEFLEELAHAAAETTRRCFGRAVSLFAPLYLGNYCENRCAYCGFQAGSALERKKLSLDEIERECAALAATGIQSCLLLTGESRLHTPPAYMAAAIAVAARHFPTVDLEVYPLSIEEYHELYCAGADGVTLFQETYDRKRYDELHLAGPKKNYDYRVGAPERIAEAGMRRISMGVLLGLADWRKDVPELFRHVRRLEKRYPGVEYGFSFPRLRQVAHDTRSYPEVSDRDMVKVICAARLLFPRTGIALSTRETAKFRDAMTGLGVTKISAGSSTRVGGYADPESDYEDGQFRVHDSRSLAEIRAMLERKGYDAVTTDWRNIVNQ